MLVRNVEPRLIRVGGEFIAPNQTVEIADNAVGLKALIQRGVLMPVGPAPEKDISPAPEKDISPAPEKDISPAPEKDISPAPEKDISPAPEKGKSKKQE